MTTNTIDSSAKILRQLYFLRIITITFVFLMIVLAVMVLDIHLPVIPLGLILMLMVITNLLTRYFIRLASQRSAELIYIQLLLEILLFAGVLYFTGGATNPFTFFLLITLAVSATIMPGMPTWSLTALTVVLYSLLLKFYVPLEYQQHAHHHAMGESGQFSQHVLGMWFGFLVSAVLVVWFITYLSQELKQRDQAITEARQRELRDQQMVTLGTLAAGTAHELGTPLASLAVVSSDITDGYDPVDDAELFDNQKILLNQINRCKKILSVLSDSAGESRADAGFLLAVSAFVDKILLQWRTQRPSVEYDIEQEIRDPEAQLLFDKTISQALVNLLNNAVDATNEPIQIHAHTDGGDFYIEVLDNGSGMSDEQIAMAGDISFSSKPDGLGIGLFLAITTIRRSGGSVSFKRRQSAGTCTTIHLPLLQLRHD